MAKVFREGRGERSGGLLTQGEGQEAHERTGRRHRAAQVRCCQPESALSVDTELAEAGWWHSLESGYKKFPSDYQLIKGS